MANLRYLLLLSLSMLACNHEETSPAPSSAELLAGYSIYGKTWQIHQIEVELGALIPNTCLTDNYITYYPDGRYEMGEGKTKCDPMAPPSYSGIWFFNKTETHLTIEVADSVQVWDIKQLDAEVLSISSGFKEGSRTYTFFSSK